MLHIKKLGKHVQIDPDTVQKRGLKWAKMGQKSPNFWPILDRIRDQLWIPTLGNPPYAEGVCDSHMRARAEQNALWGSRAIGKNPDLRFFDLNTRAEIAKNRCFEKMFYSYKVFAKKTWSEKNPKNRQK